MALVFNIQRYSIHDGPGIRTTVFFKGCPLNCIWCHNPESQNFMKELMIYKDKCIGCGMCKNVCEKNAINNSNNCDLCGECAAECPTNSRVLAGEDMTLQQIVTEIQKDRAFYDQSCGGVTLSGGEPLAQGEFVINLVKELKGLGINVALDTCGYASWDTVEKILPFVDLFLYDLKLVNDQKHLLYTGVSNKNIIENLIMLTKTDKKVWIRIPIIPGVNDGIDDINDFIRLLKEHSCYYHINLLPYHNISQEKYKRLNKAYKLEDTKIPDMTDLQNIKDMFEKENFNVKIGG